MSVKPVQLSLVNYKRFEAFRLDLSKDILLISGQNGSGKTQLLWACLLFFEAYNKRCDNLRIQNFNLNAPHLSLLLCCESLRYLSSLSSFVNKVNSTSSSSFTEFHLEFSNYMTTTIKVEFNGITTFHYQNDFLPSEKIQFAFQSLGFHFCHWNEEKAQKNILTSASQNMRTLYKDLEESYRMQITYIMKELFPIETIILSNEGELLVYEKNAIEATNCLEIMFCGSACQKVLSGLILLHTLISCPSPSIKFFLIEETEALFYPSLAIHYFHKVRELCCLHRIQLILSTNSPDIISAVNNDCKICLSLELAGEKVLEDTLHQLLRFKRSDTKPVLVCDGPHDALFIELFMQEVFEKVHIITSSAQLNNNYLLVALHNASRAKIIRLRDPEFLPPQYYSAAIAQAKAKVLGSFPISLYFHQFNSAEGYFILNRIISDSSGSELLKLLDHLKSNVALENFKKGIDNAFGTYKELLPYGGQFYLECFQMWTTLPQNVLKLYENAQQNPTEYLNSVALLVTLVRGHTFVSNTPQLMKSQKAESLHPYVQDKINTLKESIICEL